MQIFYDKIQGLTVGPTDSIQHVKNLIEVRSSMHTLLTKTTCILRVCEAHTYLSERPTSCGAPCLSSIESYNAGEMWAASSCSAAHLWRETAGRGADSGRSGPRGWQHHASCSPPAWR